MVRIVYVLKGIFIFALTIVYLTFLQSWKTFDDNPLLQVSATVFLAGPYNSGINEMNDNLRNSGLLPNTDPYFGTTMSAPTAFNPNGSNSVVDWVIIRLREKTNPTIIIAERAALVQRDGDVVEADGVNPVQFNSLPCDDYFVEIGHRNHLSAGTNTPIAICTTPVSIDFSNPGLMKFGMNPVRNIMGVDVLWAGDANGDGLVRYAGQGTDANPISELNWICTGSFGAGTPCPAQYAPEDTNMDGNIDYNSPSIDVDVIQDNVSNHPANSGTSPTFPIMAQTY